MTKRCCARTCFNAQNVNRNVTYFNFPKNMEYAKLWAEAADRVDIVSKPISNIVKYVLCSEHFTDECFCDPPFNTRLKKTIRPIVVPIPTIFKCNIDRYIPKNQIITKEQLESPSKKSKICENIRFTARILSETNQRNHSENNMTVTSIINSNITSLTTPSGEHLESKNVTENYNESMLVHDCYSMNNPVEIISTRNGCCNGRPITEIESLDGIKVTCNINTNVSNSVDHNIVCTINSNQNTQMETISVQNSRCVKNEFIIEDGEEDPISISDTICRLCSSISHDNVKLIPLFDNESNAVYNNINRLLPDCIYEDDGYPQQVCLNCIDKVGYCINTIDELKNVQLKFRKT